MNAETCGTRKLKVEYRRVAELIPYAANSRTHSEAQVAQIAASIREFGWANPILVDERNTIIAGHGRLLAAQKLGEVDVPCIVITGLTDAQRRALVIADNKLALNAGWDEQLLASELRGLMDEGFDMGLLGFADSEVSALLADRSEGLTDANAIPEVPKVPLSRLGDVWILGQHRIVCGDSTDPAAVAKCLNGVVPHLMVTDPPYGVDYDPNWRHGEAAKKHSFRNTVLRSGTVENDDRADWREVWALFPGAVAYVWHGALHSGVVQDSLAAAGFECRSQIIWRKQSAPLSRGDYHWQHEPCWYAVRRGKTGGWKGDRKQTTVWEIDSLNPVGRRGKKGSAPENNRTNHSTQKPVDCMKRPMENNSSAGQAVYEPFSGSGSTIIAGEMLGRLVHAIELNPAYVDVAVVRWQEFTGRKAVLEGDGREFAAVGIERLKVKAA